ncbi:MAG: ATP-binding protein [Pseudomonadota bacterium]
MTHTGPMIRTREIRELNMRIAILSVQEEVSNVVAHICEWLGGHGVAEDIRGELELVLAEALNNVVEHAYLYREDGEIEINVKLTPDEMTATITDSGQKFDGPPPLTEVDVDGFAFDDLPEGGFGWNLIRTLTDNVHFERRENKNCLRLSRNLNPDVELV